MNSQSYNSVKTDFSNNRVKGGDKNLGIFTATANQTGEIVELINRTSMTIEIVANSNVVVGSEILIELSYDGGLTFLDYENIHFNHNGNLRHITSTYASHIRTKFTNSAGTNSTGYVEIYYK